MIYSPIIASFHLISSHKKNYHKKHTGHEIKCESIAINAAIEISKYAVVKQHHEGSVHLTLRSNICSRRNIPLNFHFKFLFSFIFSAAFIHLFSFIKLD